MNECRTCKLTVHHSLLKAALLLNLTCTSFSRELLALCVFFSPGMKLIICLILAVVFETARSINMSSEEVADFFADEADGEQIVLVPAVPAGKAPRPSQSRGRGSSADVAEICFLCGEPIDTCCEVAWTHVRCPLFCCLQVPLESAAH